MLSYRLGTVTDFHFGVYLSFHSNYTSYFYKNTADKYSQRSVPNLAKHSIDLAITRFRTGSFSRLSMYKMDYNELFAALCFALL